MFPSQSSFTPLCQMRRLTANYNLMLRRWPGYSKNCGQNTTGRKPPSFWQMPALSRVSLPLGWSQDLISGSPLAQSAAKLLAFCLVGLLLIDRNTIMDRYPIETMKSTKAPGAQGLCQCVSRIRMRRWVQNPVTQLQIEIQLRQIRWCVHFLHVFLMLSWFCKHYRWHFLSV